MTHTHTHHRHVHIAIESVMISTILDLAFCILVSSLLLDIMAWRERSWHGYSPSSWQSWDWRQDSNGDWWYWPGQTEWEREWQSSWQSYDNQDGRSRSREQQGQQAPRSPDMPPPKGKGKRKGKKRSAESNTSQAGAQGAAEGITSQAQGSAEGITSQKVHENPGAQRAKSDPDAEKVYCYVPWVMKDYPQGSFYPSRQDIDDMDCYMMFRSYRRGTTSRVTIWGRNALGAWHHFLEKTKEVLEEKMPLYEEFYENFGIVTNDGTDEPEDDGPGDSFIKAGWLPKTFFVRTICKRVFFTKQKNQHVIQASKFAYYCQSPLSLRRKWRSQIGTIRILLSKMSCHPQTSPRCLKFGRQNTAGKNWRAVVA